MAAKSLLFILLFFTSACGACFSQKGWSRQPIQVTVGRKLIFHQGEEERNLRDLMRIVSYDEQAYKLMSSAKGHKDLRNFSRMSGAMLMAIPTVQWASNDDPLWAFMAAGIALWCVSFPLHNTYEKKAAHAAQMHNANLIEQRKAASSKLDFRPVFSCGATSHAMLGFSFNLRW